MSTEEGIESKLKNISTRFSDLDYKIDTIMTTGGGNTGDAARENSMTAILKNFQDIKREHSQLLHDMEKMKAEHKTGMEEILNTFHTVSLLEEDLNSKVKQNTD